MLGGGGGATATAELFADLVLGEAAGAAAEQGGALFGGHGDLAGAEGHEAAGEVVVVAEQEPHRQHQVVDVVEDQRLLPPVRRLVLHEVHRVLPPVPPRVQVMRHVVPVVVAIPVAL